MAELCLACATTGVQHQQVRCETCESINYKTVTHYLTFVLRGTGWSQFCLDGIDSETHCQFTGLVVNRMLLPHLSEHWSISDQTVVSF